MKEVEIVIEKHPDRYVAYPLDIQGVGVGDTGEEALRNVQSAIEFHVATFGPEVLDGLDASKRL